MLVRRLWWSALLLAAALAGGCGSAEEATQVAPPEDPPERLGGSTEVSLTDLLGRPRAELAALADEWATRAQAQETARRERRFEMALLPEARFPLIVPVLREARFVAAAGISLPPYASPGQRDSDLAVHLARYGDDEAARKLVDPADAEALRRIDECRCGRTYPVEWSRLVGLMLHLAQARLAAGETDAATDLVLLHRQVKDVLDPKAAAGPLGAALLPAGRSSLARAVPAWREAQRTALLAGDVEGALASWGDTPRPAPAVAPGAARADVARLLRGQAQGRVIPAPATGRGLDLLDLPLPPEGAQAVLTFFDTAGRLSEILVTYRPGVAPIYPEPRDLARAIDDAGVTGQDAKSPGLLSRNYPLGGFTCETMIVARGNPVGALVRFAGGAADRGALPRELGGVHLGRGFEQNRVRLAPDQAGPVAKTDKPAALAPGKGLLRGVAPAQAAVAREGDGDATARVLRYAGDGTATLHQTALRLWAEHGAARIVGQEDQNGGHLAFVWEDGRTRLTLRWPYANEGALELEAEDATSAEAVRRAADAATFDRDERRARLAAGTPLRRLPRSLDFDGVQLGATRAAVLKALPRGERYVKQTIPGGVLLAFNGEAPKAAPYVARLSFVRFDAQDKVVELRTRYGDGTAGNGGQALLTALKRRCGVPAEQPGSWLHLWDDLPPRPPAATTYRWSDDVAVMTCQRDAGAVEVTLCDASDPEAGAAAALPPLEYLPRGPAGEPALGTTREELMRRAGDQPRTLPDGAVVLTPAAPGPYDSVAVWLDGDRVTRVVARCAQAAPPKATPAQLTQLLTAVWGREGRAFGWPSRQDVAEGQALRGLGWHDERTRARLFWQEAEDGPPRLFVEWKEMGAK